MRFSKIKYGVIYQQNWFLLCHVSGNSTLIYNFDSNNRLFGWFGRACAGLCIGARPELFLNILSIKIMLIYKKRYLFPYYSKHLEFLNKCAFTSTAFIFYIYKCNQT